ncbi:MULTISPECIES: hypothetical protein [Winslowiella]|uniref:hypothetical protein n=1 Tax=Winslowiella TaxID=2997349 RepID=UPI0028BDD12A|nr:hypothetical protein [Winslowiella toletana]WNN43538.1 hypothetical protein RIN69_17905 [Winslowiella toletana]
MRQLSCLLALIWQNAWHQEGYCGLDDIRMMSLQDEAEQHPDDAWKGFRKKQGYLRMRYGHLQEGE